MKDYSWVLLSFSLAILTALGALILKYIGTNYTRDRDTSMIIGLIVAFSAGILAFGLLCYYKNKALSICSDINSKHRTVKYMIPVLAIIFILNVCLTIYTLNKVENPAYAQIIKNTNVVFILLLSIVLFKTKVNKSCIIGVLLCLLGIGIIIFNN